MKMNVDVVQAGTSARVLITDAQKERLGWEQSIPVAFELDGERFRATLLRANGNWCFVANTRMRERGLSPGRRYTIDIARDQEPEYLD